MMILYIFFDSIQLELNALPIAQFIISLSNKSDAIYFLFAETPLKKLYRHSPTSDEMELKNASGFVSVSSLPYDKLQFAVDV